ncbi:hypothetical protein HPS174_1323 [Glaesserella parasuis 174]|nr:hypothetical protein HPSMNH_1767 [Glaesserella parasuis MN-H]EPZ99024.1 hypothetical protein HPSNAG_2223 [Glaesserella parasuis str. Nagasaki]EQA07247.1 hypothetical protein HPS8415995_2157 [Glaesserella parasuis 84-15995]EQA11852.1 hypothetical protein HPS174_1323 [Glaesserella parasuis 174]EQA12099.1 hypothetical protein HPSSW140_1375 [Glaesserella parasuis SW140]EQA95103.1 hypothetical protein HPS_1489 [Glaesserella parasuis 29755]
MYHLFNFLGDFFHVYFEEILKSFNRFFTSGGFRNKTCKR